MFSSIKKIACVISAALLFSGCSTPQKQKHVNDIGAATVMVTNHDRNHGGTGIILMSFKTQSIILTNSHVCEVVKNGGLVTSMHASYMVAGYKQSTHHDLCLIKVEGSFGNVYTEIAQNVPRPYYDEAYVSGHPNLLPIVKTHGHFSGIDRFPVLVGMRPCTGEDLSDPQKYAICTLAGGFPIIKMYQAELVTATIMPGSSGSGVYNANKELTGVIFAGSGNFGYGWMVPHESMKNFVYSEAHTLEWKTPTNIIDPFSGKENESYAQKLEKACASSNRTQIADICKILDTMLLK